MQATIVDLRYRMKEVLEALNRNEKVSVLYHNKKIATITPIRASYKGSVKEHDFFGMSNAESMSVAEKMHGLRGDRYRDI